MRGKIKKGIALVLSAALCIATCVTTIPQLSVTAYATGTRKALQLGADVLVPVMTSVEDSLDYDTKNRVTDVQYVYFDQYHKEWLAIGYDGTGAVRESGTVTLLRREPLYSTEYKADASGNSYVDSDAKSVVDAYYESAFTTVEKSAIQPRTLAQGYYSSDYSSFCDGIVDDVNPAANAWLLSTKEADLIGRAYRDTAGVWWLRSPGREDDKAAYVDGNGKVEYEGHDIYDDAYVLPAINLDISSIVFTSSIYGGKTSGTVGAGALTAPADTNTDRWQLTVLDENRNFSASRTDSGKVAPGNDISISYTGATVGVYEYVSAILLNSSGELLYYGRIVDKSTGDANGTADITIPAELEGGTYKIKVFSEQYHGSYGSYTDCASAFSTIDIVVKPTLTITAKDKTYQYNGQMQGPADTVYADSDEIADMVTVTGLKGGDTLASIEIDGQGKEVGDYDLIPSGATISSGNITDKYDVTYVKGTLHITSPKSPAPATHSVTTTTDRQGSNVTNNTEPEDLTTDYLDELRAKLAAAKSLGGKQTVTWDKGTALPYDIMKTLEDNPNITLVFSYTYQGKNYKATIPGRNVKTDPKIPWYGPLYLNGYFGANASANVNIKPMETGAVYTVKKGDTLGAIARRLNTTVDYLVKVNNIADRNKIREGQILKY